MLDDQGIYIFSLLQFNNPSYKDMFVKFFKLLQNILRHDISDVELENVKIPMWTVCVNNMLTYALVVYDSYTVGACMHTRVHYKRKTKKKIYVLLCLCRQ